MVVSAQVSIYPLRQRRIGPAVEAVRTTLVSRGLQPDVGPMSTVVSGDLETVLGALQEAFVQAATGEVVMTITLSNACPVGKQ